MALKIDKIELPLKVVWKLSRNQTKIKNNFIISLDEIYKAEIAPNIRYQETPERIYVEFEKFKNENLDSLLEVKTYLNKSNFCNSLKFALEAVFVHKEAHCKNLSVSKFLNLDEPKKIKTSFSVPIMPIEGICHYLESISHYPFLKVKVNSECAIDLVNEVSKHFQGPLRIDGNEAWDNLDDYLAFELSLKNKNIQFIEQPFKACDKELAKELFKVSKYPLMADESVEDVADWNELKEMFHIVNIKLMKAGGYYNAIELLQNAKKNNLKTMIGCMIETSLGIQSAMYLNSLGDYFDLDGHLLLQNDPFNLISDNSAELSLR